MAAITDNLSGYKDRVRRWLHELSQTGSFWSETFITQQLNVNYRRRCAQLTMSHEGFFVNVATRDITADQERYAWPPGFERATKMEIIRSDGTRVIIQRNERHYQPNAANTVSQGRDTYFPSYRPISGGFVLEPTPGTTVADGLRIEYGGLPAALDADGDSWHVDFPRSLDELVILDTVVACLDSENLLETGSVRTVARMRQEYEVDWERYIDGRIEGQNRIEPFNPHFGDYIWFLGLSYSLLKMFLIGAYHVQLYL